MRKSQKIDPLIAEMCAAFEANPNRTIYELESLYCCSHEQSVKAAVLYVARLRGEAHNWRKLFAEVDRHLAN